MRYRLIPAGIDADALYEAVCDHVGRFKVVQHAYPTSVVRICQLPEDPQLSCVTVPLIPPPTKLLQSRFGLTERQATVAALLAARLTNAEIAEILRVSIGTIRKHVEWVFARLSVSRREDVLYVLMARSALEAAPKSKELR